MSVGLAFRAFFAVLFNSQSAARVRSVLENPETGGVGQAKIEKKPAESASQMPKQEIAAPKRSEALTLLSALQRESRLVDLVMEPLDQFSDAQIGTAARDVLRDSRKTLERMFSISPLASEQEGDRINLPDSPSPARYRLAGAASSNPRNGTVVHRGWQATKCEIPKWTGNASDALVIAPVEVEA
jgi:Domain of unknown function (DUF2760)